VLRASDRALHDRETSASTSHNQEARTWLPPQPPRSTAKEKPQQGEVIAVGPGKLSDEGTRLEPDVKTGDKVLYGKYSGTEVTVDGEEYLILRESDILAVIA